MTGKPSSLFTRASAEKALRLCDLLDVTPALWAVYGDSVRQYVEAMLVTLDYHERMMAGLRGRGGLGVHRNKEGVTIRARQRQAKARVWGTRPHVCEKCGEAVIWEVARLHHIEQVSDGGTEEDGNVLLLCGNCHNKAHARCDLGARQSGVHFRAVLPGAA
jgi:hypothetical protein